MFKQCPHLVFLDGVILSLFSKEDEEETNIINKNVLHTLITDNDMSWKICCKFLEPGPATCRHDVYSKTLQWTDFTADMCWHEALFTSATVCNIVFHQAHYLCALGVGDQITMLVQPSERAPLLF